MYYLRDKVDVEILRRYVEILIFQNRKCRAKDKEAVLNALKITFGSRQYLRRLQDAKVNWLQIDPQEATGSVAAFLERAL